MATKHELAEFALSKVGHGYIFGAQGDTLESILQYFAKHKYGTNASDIGKWLDGKGIREIDFSDCSGLVMDFLIRNGLTKNDLTADGIMKNLCTETVLPEEGDLGFLVKDGRATHVGVSLGNGLIVHAYSTERGVICDSESLRDWKFYELKCLAESERKGELERGENVRLLADSRAFVTAEMASSGIGESFATYRAGNYFVYKVYGTAVNITKVNGVPGGWVRKQNVERRMAN